MKLLNLGQNLLKFPRKNDNPSFNIPKKVVIHISKIKTEHIHLSCLLIETLE